MAFPIACTTAEELDVTITPMTNEDPPRAASVDGALTIVVQNGTGTFRQDAATPLMFTAVSSDAAEVTTYGVSVDADLGAGVRPISGTVEATYSSAEAASLNFAVSAARSKTAAAGGGRRR